MFSNGIMALAAVAALLVIVFKASVTRLIPLYAIGVFTSFTFSQAGMAVHHLRLKEPRWRTGMFINGLGSFVSGAMTIIIAATKFKEGAWVILIAIPVMLLGLLRVNAHYRESAAIQRDPGRRPPLDFPRQRVIIPVLTASADGWGRELRVRSALAYAHRVFPTEIRVALLAPPGFDAGSFLAQEPLGDEVREVALAEGDPKKALLAYVRKVRREVGPGEVLNVIIPEAVANLGLRYIVRQRRLQRLKAALLSEPDVVVTNLTSHEGYEALEPGERCARAASEPAWRHVAVLLVAGVHNASLGGLRYARSLGADELHCLHVETDPNETARLVAEWSEAVPGVPLEALASPYRQIARPAFEWVRRVLDADPRTYVTIVIPEFVVRKKWHNLLHNHTPLVLKRTFLFEPSVVVAAVPYRLDLAPEGLAGAGEATPAAGH